MREKVLSFPQIFKVEICNFYTFLRSDEFKNPIVSKMRVCVLVCLFVYFIDIIQ